MQAAKVQANVYSIISREWQALRGKSPFTESPVTARWNCSSFGTQLEDYSSRRMQFRPKAMLDGAHNAANTKPSYFFSFFFFFFWYRDPNNRVLHVRLLACLPSFQ